MIEPGDQPLIDQLLDGQPEALEQVDRWIRVAAKAFRRHLGTDTDDLVQDVHLAITKALRAGRYRGDGPLQAYVTRMTRFQAIDRLRRRRPQAWVEVETLDLPAPIASPLANLAERDRVRALLDLFVAMPVECQRLWRMIVAGLSYREMSDRLDVRPGTLRVRVRRCRQKAIAAREAGNES